MSPVTSPIPPDPNRPESFGYLALVHAGKCLPLQVQRSAAGYYIGTADDNGPVSRESMEYFPSYDAASHALTTGRWHQRISP